MEMKYYISVGTVKMILFRRLRPTPILVDHDTDCVRNIISLSFYTYEERLNQR
jgi:hypothetical protein